VCAQTRLDRVTQDVRVRDALVARGIPIHDARVAISNARARLRVDVDHDILLREALREPLSTLGEPTPRGLMCRRDDGAAELRDQRS
jgi:hypothetical protein